MTLMKETKPDSSLRSVAIKMAKGRGETILNSKDEFTRCYIPEIEINKREAKNIANEAIEEAEEEIEMKTLIDKKETV